VLGLALAARAHVGEAGQRPAAHGEQEVAADEDRDLADHPVGGGVGRAALQRVHDREQGFAVLHDLGPVARVLRVLDREFVQPELVGEELEFARVRLEQADPDEAVGRLTYSEMSSTGRSASLRPFWYATQLTSIRDRGSGFGPQTS